MSKTSDRNALLIIDVVLALCDNYGLPKEEALGIANTIISQHNH